MMGFSLRPLGDGRTSGYEIDSREESYLFVGMRRISRLQLRLSKNPRICDFVASHES